MKAALLFFVALMPSWGAVAFNNTNTMQSWASSSTASAALSVTAGGSNIVAFAIIEFGNGGGITVSSITYGGNAMTSCGAAQAAPAGNSSVQIFYLINPPTGSNTLSITMSNGTGGHYNLISFTGVNQTTPVRPATYTSASGNSASPQLVVSSNASDLTMTVVGGNAVANITATNQTSDGIDNTGAIGAGSDHATTAAVSVTHTWTYSGADNWAVAGFSIQAAGGAVATKMMPVVL